MHHDQRTWGRAQRAGGPVESAAVSPSIWQRLADLLLGEKVANFAVALAIAIGFFHGWLKLQIRHPIATFLFDIPLVFALGLVAMRMKSFRDFFPPGHATRALMIFYGVVAVWFVLSAILPWGAPLVAALAAVRGWVFSTLMLGLGYQIIGSRRQLHGYFIWIILLAAVTGLYATRQTQEEVDALRTMDPYFELMTRGQSFVDDEGRLVLRRFSTFVSSGTFGGTMAVSLLLLACLVTDATLGKFERLLLLGLSLVIGWGMFLSGARSAVLCFGLGLILIVWFRKLSLQLWMLAGVCGLGLYLGAEWTGGGILDRLSSLDLQALWSRFYIVWAPGTRYLVESGFLGGGLGKAGVGFPMSLVAYIGRFPMWAVDGDLGKTMAELGIVGVVVVCWLLWAGLRDGYGIVIRNRATPVGTMGLGAMCAFSTAVLTYPTGSPFVGIPLGVLTWFFLGAAIKLDILERPISKAQADGAERTARSGMGRDPDRRGRALVQERRSEPVPAAAETSVPEETVRREKRFLYLPPERTAAGGDATQPSKSPPPSTASDPAASPSQPRRKPFLYS